MLRRVPLTRPPVVDPTLLLANGYFGLAPKAGPARPTLCGAEDAGGGRHGGPKPMLARGARTTPRVDARPRGVAAGLTVRQISHR